MIAEISSKDSINWNAKSKQEKEKEYAKNILMTRKGELPFARNVGLSDEYIDKPITQVEPLIRNDISENIYKYTDDTTFINASVENGGSAGDFDIKVVIDVE